MVYASAGVLRCFHLDMGDKNYIRCCIESLVLPSQHYEVNGPGVFVGGCLQNPVSFCTRVQFCKLRLQLCYTKRKVPWSLSFADVSKRISSFRTTPVTSASRGDRLFGTAQ